MDRAEKLENLEMAASILLSCYVCGKIYSNPKLLSCCHTFCEHCLLENVPPQSLTLTCPCCGANSILPEDGIASITGNQLFLNLMELLPVEQPQVSKEGERPTHVPNTDYQQSAVNSNTLSTTLSDSSHAEGCADFHHSYRIAPCTQLKNCQCEGGESVTTLCKLCGRLICDKCATNEHTDHESSLTPIGRVATDCRDDLLRQVEEIRERVAGLDYCLSSINSTCDELAVNRDFAEVSVKDTFKFLEQELQMRKEETLRMLDAEFTTKRLTLDRQRGDLSAALRNMTSAIQLIQLSLDKTNNNYNESNTACDDSGVVPDQTTTPQIIPPQDECYNPVDYDMKTYLLHRHMSHRLTNLRDYGRVRVSDEMLRNAATPTVSSQARIDHSHTTLGSYLCDSFGTPNDNSYFEWRASRELSSLAKTIQNVECGSVLTDHAVADKCVLSGSCLQELRNCAVGREEQMLVTAKDYLGNLEPSRHVIVNVELAYAEEEGPKGAESSDSGICDHPPVCSTPRKADSIDSSWRVDVQPNQPGSHEIRFTPSKPGKFRLNVRIHGKHVQNSPCQLTAELAQSKVAPPNGKSPQVVMRPGSVRQKAMKRPQSVGPIRSIIGDDLMLRFGSRGRSKGEFANPQGVAADGSGRFYVTDSNNQCVQVFQLKDGFEVSVKFVDRLGSRGRGVGLLQRPSGVAVLPSGELAVADYENKVVNLFTRDGKYKSKIGHGKLMGPRGICINRNGHLVVADNKSCQIFIFQLNGRLVIKFGNRGTGPSQLAGPHYIAVNQRNEIYVTDFYNHCIKVFSCSGTFISSIGSKGEGCGQFNAPTGIAIDSKSHLIVADWGNSRIQVFDEKGSFLSYINTDSEPLYGPQGVTATENGYVAVADTGNQCVKVYRILQ